MTLNLDKFVQASRKLCLISENTQTQILTRLKQHLASQIENIITQNKIDIQNATGTLSEAHIDRLMLNEQRLVSIIKSIDEVITMPSPLAEVVENKKLENGLLLKKVRVPLGRILMIFESRPNVAIDAFIIAVRSGNTLFLKGGKEAQYTLEILYSIIQKTLAEFQLEGAFIGVSEFDRHQLKELLKLDTIFDVVIPRGGDSLIHFVKENTTIPIIKNDRGMCHLYIDQDASLQMAVNILDNAKTQRPAVCNTVETVLIHQKVFLDFSDLLKQLANQKKIQLFCCPKSIAAFEKVAQPASPSAFDTEYLSLALNVKVVGSMEEAILHIQTHGSRHSEAIITANSQTAEKFLSEVDAAAVYWNASTRFTDGYEFGLGAEIGISTQKLHVRGPVGVKELTTLAWKIIGNGQIRK